MEKKLKMEERHTTRLDTYENYSSDAAQTHL